MPSGVRARLGSQPAERLVLVFGLVLGILAIAPLFGRVLAGNEVDFHAYYFAGKKVLQGEPFVGYAIMDGTFLVDKAYVYLPITVVFFAIYALSPTWEPVFVIHVLFMLGTLAAVGVITIRYIESHGPALDRIDRYLIVGFCLFSVPSVLGVYRGSIEPIIFLFVVGGFLAVEGERESFGGGLWAFASLFKFFPAFFGIWLLYRRAWRGVAAALVVGLGATGLSVLAFGFETNIEFVEFILTERSREGAFQGGLDPEFMWITLRRPLSYLVPLTGHALTLLAFGIVAPILGLMFARAKSDLEHLVAFFALLIVMLITLFPSTAGYVIYILFPLVPLVYLVEDRWPRACFLAGLVLINVPLFAPQVEQLFIALPDVVVIQAVGAGLDILLTFASLGLLGFLVTFAGCLLYVLSDETDVTASQAMSDG